ncbi:MAG TPA: sugar phosphate isomerase/epimerase family protein [Nitrospirales bacterium]|nr:sugar phosphate isomerase/epimerase family protein [Nitrospirales bacterium]
MKIAGHTMGTPSRTPAEAMELFSRTGISGIELIMQDGYRSAVPITVTKAALREIRQRAADLGIQIAFLAPYITALNSLDKTTYRAQVDLLKRAVEVAVELGAPGLRVYGGKEVPEADWQPHFRRLVDGLRLGGEMARAAGVKLAVENHQTTMTVSARETMEVVRAVGLPSVGVLYDQANLSHMHQEEFAEALEVQRGHIVHVHVKDFVKKPGRERSTSDTVAFMPAEGRAIITRVVGEGIVPWGQILPALRSIGYDGWLSLEMEKRWYPDELPPEEEAFRRSAAFLRGLLA